MLLAPHPEHSPHGRHTHTHTHIPFITHFVYHLLLYTKTDISRPTRYCTILYCTKNTHASRGGGPQHSNPGIFFMKSVDLLSPPRALQPLPLLPAIFYFRLSRGLKNNQFSSKRGGFSRHPAYTAVRSLSTSPLHTEKLRILGNRGSGTKHGLPRPRP